MVSTVTTARCNACGWVPAGDPDKAAEKHTKASGHPTVTKMEPVR